MNSCAFSLLEHVVPGAAENNYSLQIWEAFSFIIIIFKLLSNTGTQSPRGRKGNCSQDSDGREPWLTPADGWETPRVNKQAVPLGSNSRNNERWIKKGMELVRSFCSAQLNTRRGSSRGVSDACPTPEQAG